jgi:aspartyl-tRNA(Asn)/glutamyl-tRNA(Gln) amidotransferase subunit B
MPREKEARLAEAYGLSAYDAGLLAQDRSLADYFEAVVRSGAEAKVAANWILNDLARLMNDRGLSARALPLEPGRLAELIALASDGTVNTPTARKLLERLVDGEEGAPGAIVEAEGLGQVTETGPLAEALEAAIRENPKAVSDIENGKPQTAMFFVGQVMRATGGQADPQIVAGVIAERFGIDPALLQKKKKDKKKKQES